MARQGEDGGFHSTTYGAFRDGRAVTPLVLMGLWGAGRADDPAYASGVDFVAAGPAEPEGYPVYTLALTLLVLSTPANERHHERIEPFSAALRAQQLEDGGWGYMPSASNISSTLYAIGGLRLSGTPADGPVLVRALAFVRSCQNVTRDGGTDDGFEDGGFFFAPNMPDGNKAGPAGEDAEGRTRYRSFGSATADGTRALLQLGSPADGPRVRAAAGWLRSRFSTTESPGEFPPDAEYRRRSAYHYYVWSAAHAMRATGETAFAGPLAKELLARQNDDGTWTNESTELREDDPLVATPFALAALAVSRAVLAGEPRSHAAR